MVTGTDLLVATGRVPNTLTSSTRPRGVCGSRPIGRVCVDQHQRTSVPGVVGSRDISSPYMLKLVANHEGAKVVAHNIANGPTRCASRTTSPVRACGVHPPADRQRRNDEADGWRRQGIDVMISTHKLLGRRLRLGAGGHTGASGMLVADRHTRRLVGGPHHRPHASSLIQQLIHALVHPCTIDELATGSVLHPPALGEVVENALLGFASQPTEAFH
jgi:mycothione reductase